MWVDYRSVCTVTNKGHHLGYQNEQGVLYRGSCCTHTDTHSKDFISLSKTSLALMGRGVCLLVLLKERKFVCLRRRGLVLNLPEPYKDAPLLLKGPPPKPDLLFSI